MNVNNAPPSTADLDGEAKMNAAAAPHATSTILLRVDARTGIQSELRVIIWSGLRVFGLTQEG